MTEVYHYFPYPCQGVFAISERFFRKSLKQGVLKWKTGVKNASMGGVVRAIAIRFLNFRRIVYRLFSLKRHLLPIPENVLPPASLYFLEQCGCRDRLFCYENTPRTLTTYPGPEDAGGYFFHPPPRALKRDTAARRVFCRAIKRFWRASSHCCCTRSRSP